MKNAYKFYLLGLVFALSSCSPKTYFLGDSYPATSAIDVFYDEKDVGKDYNTIGHITHAHCALAHVDKIKNAMIENAKEQGGNGIIFTNTTSVYEESESSLSITAKVIRYKE